MYDSQAINLHEIMTYWEPSNAELIKLFHPDSPRIVAEIIKVFKEEVPEGFEYFDFPKSSLGTCWIYGKEDEVHSIVCNCWEAVQNAGIEIGVDENGVEMSFENCLCPHFTTPDEKGNVILLFCKIIITFTRKIHER